MTGVQTCALPICKFATEYIPRCILIGKDGRIKCQTVGFSKDDFRKLIIGATFETAK